MSESDNKKLSDLRVVDLKAELEKRGLERTGKKETLVERLTKALKDEGKDPETYPFESSDKKRRSSTYADDDEKSEITEADSSGIEANSKIEKKEGQEKTEKMEPKTDKSTASNNGETHPTDDTDGHEIPLRLTLEDEETLHDDEADTTTDKLSNEEGEDDKTNSSNEASKEDSKSKDSATTGQEGSKDDKETGDAPSAGKVETKKGKVSANLNPKVVWISNVAQNTRASELKTALSACGKVTGAKVVVNARFPGSSCFGYVTMGTVEDADNVIAKLNNTELNGQIIKIEKFDHVRAEQMKQMRMGPGKAHEDPKTKKELDNKDKKDDNVKPINRSETGKSPKTEDNAPKDKDKKLDKKGKDIDKKDDRMKRKADDKERPDFNRPRKEKRRVSDSRARAHEVLTFDKIRRERERQRLHEKERKLREETRRRHQEALRQRDVERHQRSEAQRLEREREKLKMEREKIENEKAELDRLKRERADRERELKNIMRLQEARRASRRPEPYSFRREFDEMMPVSDGHFKEPPPPPRFDPPSKLSYENRHEQSYQDKRNNDRNFDVNNRSYKGSISGSSRSSSGNMNKYDRPYDARESRDPRNRDIVLSRPKDNRYVDRNDRDRSPHSFRGNIRDDRRSDSKPDIITRDQRYSDSVPEPRFDRNNQGSDWNSHSSSKSFNSGGSNLDPWLKDTWRHEPPSDRGNSGPSGRSLNNQFSGNSNMQPACPPPPGLVSYPVRFEYNKNMNSGMRKY